MRSHWSATISLKYPAKPRSKHNGTSERNHPTNGMNHRRSGKVAESLTECWKEISCGSHICQPAIGSPCPVTDDRVNETGNPDTVKNISTETRSADHAAGSNG